MFSASYVGSKGRQLPRFIDVNLPSPTTLTYTVGGGPAPHGQTQTRCRSSKRHAARELRPAVADHLRRRHDVQPTLSARAEPPAHQGPPGAQTSYTFARARDNGQSSQTFSTGNNVLNPMTSAAKTPSRISTSRTASASAPYGSRTRTACGSTTSRVLRADHRALVGRAVLELHQLQGLPPATRTLDGHSGAAVAVVCRRSSATRSRPCIRRESSIRIVCAFALLGKVGSRSRRGFNPTWDRRSTVMQMNN